jgi:hypothetical protein
LSQSTSHFFCEGNSMIESHELFDKLALNHDPPNLCLLFLVVRGFGYRTSSLQSSLSTTWAIPPVHLVLLLLEMGSLKLFGLAAWKQKLPISNSYVARIKGMGHYSPAADHVKHCNSPFLQSNWDFLMLFNLNYSFETVFQESLMLWVEDNILILFSLSFHTQRVQ